MAFGLGSILGAISSVVSPIASIIGTIISPSRPPPPQGRPIFLPAPVAQAPPSGGLVLPVGLPVGSFRFGSQVGPTVQPVAAGALVPFVAGGAVALVRGILARASAFIGARISASRVLALVRDVGLVSAAAALGITAVEVAQVIAAKPRRRRRGITARDIATTKRVIRTTHRIQHDLGHLAGPARRRHHHHRTAR